MLSLESLREYGANVGDGLNRCLNNETFYLNMVRKAVASLDPSGLRAAAEAGDLDKAFDICHNMKGVTGNLSLTPLYLPVCEMTELLRSRTGCDYSPYIARIEEQVSKLRALCEA